MNYYQIDAQWDWIHRDTADDSRGEEEREIKLSLAVAGSWLSDPSATKPDIQQLLATDRQSVLQLLDLILKEFTHTDRGWGEQRMICLWSGAFCWQSPKKKTLKKTAYLKRMILKLSRFDISCSYSNTELCRAAPVAAQTVKVALSLRMNPSFSFQSRSGELPRASCCVSHEFKVKYPTQKETE